mmetsp:Transcript_12748/g.41489  ORF Transcript_12748/g.41489 Transcript_12748/m.41489 type:complete len:255 (+) Transcript_12748:1457-2221(+)
MGRGGVSRGVEGVQRGGVRGGGGVCRSQCPAEARQLPHAPPVEEGLDSELPRLLPRLEVFGRQAATARRVEGGEGGAALVQVPLAHLALHDQRQQRELVARARGVVVAQAELLDQRAGANLVKRARREAPAVPLEHRALCAAASAVERPKRDGADGARKGADGERRVAGEEELGGGGGRDDVAESGRGEGADDEVGRARPRRALAQLEADHAEREEREQPLPRPQPRRGGALTSLLLLELLAPRCQSRAHQPAE